MEVFINSENFNLNVYITHFVPPKKTFLSLFKSFLLPRFNSQYLRSWFRLIKYGHRGNQPWKKDVMTSIRNSDQPNRNLYLIRVLQSLSDLKVKNLNVNIITNSDSIQDFIGEMGFSCKISFHIFPKYNQMNQLHNSPWDENKLDSPWYLVWEHKSILKNDLFNSNSDTLFLYLENDILFTQKNLDYWISNYEKIKSKNLIPSFVRIEYSKKFHDWTAIDNLEAQKIEISKCNRITVNDSIFMQLPNTYCGIYLLDYELAKNYVNSDAFTPLESRKLTWWDLGARSAMGLQFIDCPSGFSSRHVVEINQTNLQFNNGALIHHLPNLYTNIPNSGYKFIPISELISKKLT